MQAQRHLEKKHGPTWQMMEMQRVNSQRSSEEEDRQINRMILAKLAGVELEIPNSSSTTGEPDRLSDSPVETLVEEVVKPVTDGSVRRKRRPMTEEQKERARENLAKARAARKPKAE